MTRMLEVFRTLPLTSLDVTIETLKRKWGKKKRRMLSGSGGSIGMGAGAVIMHCPGRAACSVTVVLLLCGGAVEVN